MLNEAVLLARGVVKAYGGLRPLRVTELAVRRGEVVALEGPDEPAAAVLVDLVTGTTLPDAGEIVVNGTSTAALAGHDEWLAFLEQFGIVNRRVVLLDDLTVRQNLAVPLTLDLDPLPAAVDARVAELAALVGLPAQALDARVESVTPTERFLLRLGRAVAHEPTLLLIEHPTLGLAPHEADTCSDAIRSVASARRIAALVVTRDAALARRTASRRLAWDPKTGQVAEGRGWKQWFSAR